MSEGIRRRSLDHPEALDDKAAGLDARIRYKFDRGEPLSPEEKAFLADLPASREIPPEEVRASAAAHGGVRPIDAATGEPHDATKALEGSRSSAVKPPHDEEP